MLSDAPSKEIYDERTDLTTELRYMRQNLLEEYRTSRNAQELDSV